MSTLIRVIIYYTGADYVQISLLEYYKKYKKKKKYIYKIVEGLLVGRRKSSPISR